MRNKRNINCYHDANKDAFKKKDVKKEDTKKKKK